MSEIVCSVLMKPKCSQSLSAACSTGAACLVKMWNNAFSEEFILFLFLCLKKDIFIFPVLFAFPFVHIIDGVSCANGSQRRGTSNRSISTPLSIELVFSINIREVNYLIFLTSKNMSE